MSGLSVAGFTLGKTDRFSVGDELGADITRPKRLHVGCFGLSDGISRAGRGNPPSIDDGENYWFRVIRHT